MFVFISLLIQGLVLGSIYGLIALDYSLIFKASGLTTFVHGDIMTLGAFLGITFFGVLHMPYWLALVLTIVIAFFLGMMLERGIIRRLLGKNVSQIYVVLATIAIANILQNIIQLRWGGNTISFPSIFKSMSVKVFGVNIQPERLLSLGIAVSVMLILHFFISKTRIGISIRAVAMDSMAAKVCGINTSLTTGFTWGISAGLAAIAGILIGPIFGVASTLGAQIGRKGFVGAIIGGYGNMYGAMVGGIILGVVETLSAGYISSEYKNIIAYIILLLFLFAKPTGIYNECKIKDI